MFISATFVNNIFMIPIWCNTSYCTFTLHLLTFYLSVCMSVSSSRTDLGSVSSSTWTHWHIILWEDNAACIDFILYQNFQITFYRYIIYWCVMLVCFYEAVFEADLSMGLWRPPKECTHECSQPSLLLLCRNWFLTGQTGFINFSHCKNRFNQQTSSSQSYFWIQPFKTVLASWAYYIVRMMLFI